MITGDILLMRDGGKLLVECLYALGVRTCFGVPGESYLAVLNALYDFKGSIDFTVCRNEGGAAFMAAAYGKLTHTPGICMVTRGPGAANASIGIHTARQDSTPMLVFIGQVGTGMLGREAFQEVDYFSMFGTVAKWAVEIRDVNRIPEILARAWKTALAGRPGPVVIALPEDILHEKSQQMPLHGTGDYPEPAPPPASVVRTAKILCTAKRPVILYGGCNWTDEGSAALQQFAERANIPVVAAFRYQDQFDNHSPCFCGEAGVGMIPSVQELIRNADVILAINNRFGENSTAGYTLLDVPLPHQRLIHIHTSEQELGKIYQPELGIVSGPNSFAQALAGCSVAGDWSEWRAWGRSAFLESLNLPDLPSPVDMGKVTKHLQNVLPDNVIVTNGAGNFTAWPNKFFLYGRAARLLAPQAGAMGYGIPAAIAAKIVYPERTVVCFAGDGDFQMTCQELATATQIQAQPIILVLNNGVYGTIRAHQETHYPERVLGTNMTNPDFVLLAQAYGFYAEKIQKTEDFPDAFARALKASEGAVLELDISAEAISPRATITGIRAQAKQKSVPKTV